MQFNTHNFINLLVILVVVAFGSGLSVQYATAAEIESIQQDGRRVTGTVRDADGQPLPGASIQVQGTSQYAITDLDGKFTVEHVADDALLVVSFIGFETQNLILEGCDHLDIQLVEDSKLLDEVVVVGYGSQRKDNMTGSVSSIKSESLVKAPVTNVTNTLGGQLPGLRTKQTSGIPGSDGAQLSIRGFKAPLVIVDGVESNFNNIDPSQIDSISILKDGAASIYGARAGNGVILVTLKKGTASRPTVTLNASVTMQNSTNLIKTGSSGQRAEWERESHMNANKPMSQIPWTLTDIKKFYKGNDPDYINSDWFSAAVRPWAPQQNHNLSVSGGTEKVKYYTYVGYNNQSTISRHDGGAYNRLNMQSNVDVNIVGGLDFSLGLNYIYENRNFTAMNLGNSNFYYALYDSDPRYPLTLPDENLLSYAGSSYGNAVFVSSRDLAGYSKSKNHDLRATGALTYRFQKVKGLQLKAFVNMNMVNSQSKMFRKQPEFYSYNRGTDEYIFERKAQDPTMLNQGSSAATGITQQYSISYDNTFDNAHHVSALLLHERINYADESFNTSRGNLASSVLDQMFAGDATTASNSGYASEMARKSYVVRLNYGFRNRYLIETILRADASSKFPKKGRWGVFPSVSLGWVLSQEEFLRNSSAVDFLKIRASYGQSGDDGIGNYQYFAGYSYDMSYILDDKIAQGLYATGLANEVLSWEKLSIANVGVDFTMFKRKLYGCVEGFYRVRNGIPGYRTNSLPSTFGQELPLENLNSMSTQGFEFQIGSAATFGNFSYDISANISWSRSRWLSFDEPDYTDPDQKRIYGHTGQWTDARYGYVSDGLFTSMEEIMDLPYQYVELGGNEALRPGDVKYLDINNDKKLDWRDQVEVGQSSIPNWMYGFNIDLAYRNFNISALFQGAFGYSSYIDLESAPTTLKFENRWTEKENNKYSLVPRPGSTLPSNWWSSDFRIHNASYLRLKNLSIGYSLGPKALKKSRLGAFRIYLAGTNLLTVSNLKKYGVDPEAPDGSPAYYYPQQRTISVGLTLTY